MYLCYIDESGTSATPGNTSHFVLAGMALPIWHWKDADREITRVLARYDLADQEFHTAWLLRKYFEQTKIPNFDTMNYAARKAAVQRQRTAELLRLQRTQRHSQYRLTKKMYKHTEGYMHLTLAERISVVRGVADTVSGWGFARLFAECIDKVHFDPTRTERTIDEQAFEQVVSRFDRYLANMQERQGTLWRQIGHIIETPLFVDSKLTRMVQVADLCAYSLRRFVENGDVDLFRRTFARADRVGVRTVGVRHFAGLACICEICAAHLA
jgi:hypothetical protein